MKLDMEWRGIKLTLLIITIIGQPFIVNAEYQVGIGVPTVLPLYFKSSAGGDLTTTTVYTFDVTLFGNLEDPSITNLKAHDIYLYVKISNANGSIASEGNLEYNEERQHWHDDVYAKYEHKVQPSNSWEFPVFFYAKADFILEYTQYGEDFLEYIETSFVLMNVFEKSEPPVMPHGPSSSRKGGFQTDSIIIMLFLMFSISKTRIYKK